MVWARLEETGLLVWIPSHEGHYHPKKVKNKNNPLASDLLRPGEDLWAPSGG